MEKVVITEEMLASAKSYATYTEKKQFLDDCADRCFDELQISADGGAGVILMPPMYKKSPLLVRRYMLGAFVRLYFGIKYETDGNEWLMSVSAYDQFSASHIFNQLERIKSSTRNPETRDKVFDILADYRELEKMMNDEIYSYLQVMNEPVTRFVTSLQSSTTPENLKAAEDKLNATRKEMDDYYAQKKAGGSSADA